MIPFSSLCQRRTDLSLCAAAAGWFGISGLTQIPKAHGFRHSRERKKKKIPCIWLIFKEELPDFSAESLSTSSRPLGNARSPASPYQPSRVHLVPRAFAVGWPQATQFSCPLCFRHPVAHLPLVGPLSLLDQQIFKHLLFHPSQATRGFTPLPEKGIPRPC